MLKNRLFLDALAVKPVERHPVWLMRQAGRYLPEYRELRSRHTLDALFHTAELAVEVTLMPLKRMPLDAAIVFSDLLVLLEVFDKVVHYPDSGGIFLSSAVREVADLRPVEEGEIQQTLSYLFDSIDSLKSILEVPLIGFCGAPFTLLCYLLEGKGQEFSQVAFWMEHRETEFSRMLDILCDVCIRYARLQAYHGVDAIQIFDSWTHLLSREQFSSYAVAYWKKMVEGLRDLKVPVIFFSKVASAYPELIASIEPQGISFDEGVPLADLRDRVDPKIAVQGNFPIHLLAEGSVEQVKSAAEDFLDSIADKRGVIVNLGHGVLPHTPVANVRTFVECCHNARTSLCHR